MNKLNGRKYELNFSDYRIVSDRGMFYDFNTLNNLYIGETNDNKSISFENFEYVSYQQNIYRLFKFRKDK